MTSTPRNPEPPIAPKKPKETVVHGEVLRDDYHWLRDRLDPDTMAYIEAENRYTDEVMSRAEGLRGELYDELVRRTAEEDSEPRTRIDEFYYNSKTKKGKQFPILCRQPVSGGEEQIVLDQNSIAEEFEFCVIGDVKVSADHTTVAFSYDTTGAEYYHVGFIDIATQNRLPDTLVGTGGFEWGSSVGKVYYIIHDDVHRPYRVMRHTLGGGQEADEVVYEEPDPGCEYMSLAKSKSKDYLFITAQTLTTGEVNFLRSDDDSGKFQPVALRKKGVRYYVLHKDDDFLIITNDNAPNFKIMRTPVSAIHPENWTEVLPHRDSIIIDVSDPNPWVDVFDDYLAIFEREETVSSIRVLNLIDGDSHIIELPEKLRSVTPLENPDMSATVLRFAYTSMVTPRRIYEYDMKNDALNLLKEDEVANYNPSDYHSERVYVKAADGTKIPLNIVHREGIAKDGRNPLLLFGYGAAGDFEASAPAFDIRVLSLLERGFVYAVAAIRGGGEYGQQWYDDGRLMNKKNCFSDFIDCAEYLIDEGYTSKCLLAARGASAGGLLVAAVTMMRPDLFHAVVAEVPFVDVIHTMLDKTIPLVVGEYEEYGDIYEVEVYEYCKSYSPYENVRPVRYPNLLVTAALSDSRVPFWEPAKLVAKMRDRSAADNLILLRTKILGGHSEPFARYDSAREEALKLAFIIDRVVLNAQDRSKCINPVK